MLISEYLKAFRLGHLKDAIKILQKIPEEGSSLSNYKKLMLERLLELETNGLPSDWDGVYTAETK